MICESIDLLEVQITRSLQEDSTVEQTSKKVEKTDMQFQQLRNELAQERREREPRSKELDKLKLLK